MELILVYGLDKEDIPQFVGLFQCKASADLYFLISEKNHPELTWIYRRI